MFHFVFLACSFGLFSSKDSPHHCTFDLFRFIFQFSIIFWVFVGAYNVRISSSSSNSSHFTFPTRLSISSFCFSYSSYLGQVYSFSFIMHVEVLLLLSTLAIRTQAAVANIVALPREIVPIDNRIERGVSYFFGITSEF